ncbi:hypothetical protein [Streptomyces sp. SID12501]|uniref:Cysteine dioxygenase n=1 Tax=Streptomyces sp. SID12501 TaxID=2706042 RepID=A0A6B3BX10_9ACTN|nr:hypothetical protein [Streptomyces sp. SID12501]NEC88786.1 hypothetical protein [Streptomyces sp. SID12501]
MTAVETVRGMLAETLGDRTGGRNAGPAALEAVGRLCGHDLLGSLVEALILQVEADRPDTARRAALSYDHALGFSKLMLLTGEPDYMLRAHIWSAGPAIRTHNDPEHIHNHRFAFASAVLRGALRMRIYVPDPQGEPVAAYREEIGPGDTAWQITDAGTARLRMAADLRLEAGSRYCLDADTRHQVALTPGLSTVTCFLETAALRQTTDVYAIPHDHLPVSIPKQPLSPERYLLRLRELAELIS